MSRSRCLLHFNKLPEFQAYLERRGWVVLQPIRAAYEVLRMHHPNGQLYCILHQRANAKEHVTSWGLSQELVKDYFRSKK